MTVDLRHLRSFVAVAEEGKIGGAATRLFITQPALSRQVHELEREIGEQLFRRVPLGVELTDAGREHLEQRGEQKPPWEPEQDEEGNPRANVRHAIGGLVRTAAHVFQDGTPEQVEEALKILEDARRKLYRLLAGEE